MHFFLFGGAGSIEAPFFCLLFIGKSQKIRGYEIILALFCEKLLTFDKHLYIRGIEKNSCFICVRVLMAFEKLKPKKLNDAAWGAIIEAWENGLSDREASFRASKISGQDITADELRKWCKDDPELGELRANLQSDLLSEAKLTVADALRSKDTRTARWYLERKATDEFSTKQAVAFEGAVIELSMDEKEKALKEKMAEFFGENGE